MPKFAVGDVTTLYVVDDEAEDVPSYHAVVEATLDQDSYRHRGEDVIYLYWSTPDGAYDADEEGEPDESGVFLSELDAVNEALDLIEGRLDDLNSEKRSLEGKRFTLLNKQEKQ